MSASLFPAARQRRTDRVDDPMSMTQDISSLWRAWRERSPVVVDVPADTRRMLLQRYVEMSMRNGRLSIVCFGMLLFGLAYEAPLWPRLAAWGALGAILAVRVPLARRMLARNAGPEPRSDPWYDLLLLISSSFWGAAPCLLQGWISPMNLFAVMYAAFVAVALLAAAYVAAMPAGVVLVSFSVVPLVVLMGLQGSLLYGVLAVGTLACTLSLLQRVGNGHSALLQALAAERENAALVKELDGYRRQLESENAALGDSLRDASQAANRDPLTGLFNRRHLVAFAQPLAALVLEDREAVTLLIVDIDHFKRVNDRHGHPVGDQVLRAVAQLLGERLRDHDCLARYGGEEFIVVLRRCGVQRGLRVAESLRHNVASTEIDTDDGIVPVTVSIGVAQWGPGEQLVQVIQRADRTLYRAKQTGRDRVEVDADDALKQLFVTVPDSTLPGALH
jgi:diguanylate cyclase (GGDEF)-like protein